MSPDPTQRRVQTKRPYLPALKTDAAQAKGRHVSHKIIKANHEHRQLAKAIFGELLGG